MSHVLLNQYAGSGHNVTAIIQIVSTRWQQSQQTSKPPTWYEDGDGSLHGSADDVIHCKHPVGFNVMVPQDLVYLNKQGNKPELALMNL